MTSRHSFVRRLQLGLGLLVATTLAGLGGIVASERRVAAALERSQTALSLLDDFKEVEILLSATRAAEREFLLEDLRAPSFFQSGSSPSLERHVAELAALETLLEKIVARPKTPGGEAQAIQAAVAAYARDFASLVSLYGERGWFSTGARGAMNEASFALQELLDEEEEHAALLLRAELLALLSDRDQYLRDLDNRPQFNVGERIEILHEEIDAQQATQAETLHGTVDRFAAGWQRLLEIDDQIGRSSGAGLRGGLRAAEETVTPLALEAVTRARQGFETSRYEVAQAAAMARTVSEGAVLLAVGLASLVAFVLGGHLRRSLAGVLGAVEAYAAGDRTARVGALSHEDEFSRLGQAFDRMGESLAEATDELEEINASLEMAVKGDTAGLLERIQSLVAERRTPDAG